MGTHPPEVGKRRLPNSLVRRKVPGERPVEVRVPYGIPLDRPEDRSERI